MQVSSFHLGSFAVGGNNNLILLSKKHIFRFSSLKIIILFEISASGYIFLNILKNLQISASIFL